MKPTNKILFILFLLLATVMNFASAQPARAAGQVLRPIADIDTGGWYSPPIWYKLGQRNVWPDDYVAAVMGSNDRPFTVALAPGTDPGTDTGHAIYMYAYAWTSFGKPERLTVELLEGDTVIAAVMDFDKLQRDKPPGRWKPAINGLIKFDLAEEDVAQITDYGNLRFRVDAHNLGAGEQARIWYIKLLLP
jgi:hypothetical protein